ncbi:hypothetical protein pCXcHC2016_33 [Xenohaliotis phage pCXc-HC2016]|nr:hypothetical protein pCXcHC2016_33 [Xenohaliotis phage pCXc-HC2016]AQW89140.1 hypothetical protein pCXcHR2015_33 [Xenohaliotis phage pCXc-HR2015]
MADVFDGINALMDTTASLRNATRNARVRSIVSKELEIESANLMVDDFKDFDRTSERISGNIRQKVRNQYPDFLSPVGVESIKSTVQTALHSQRDYYISNPREIAVTNWQKNAENITNDVIGGATASTESVQAFKESTAELEKYLKPEDIEKVSNDYLTKMASIITGNMNVPAEKEAFLQRMQEEGLLNLLSVQQLKAYNKELTALKAPNFESKARKKAIEGAALTKDEAAVAATAAAMINQIRTLPPSILNEESTKDGYTDEERKIMQDRAAYISQQQFLDSATLANKQGITAQVAADFSTASGFTAALDELSNNFNTSRIYGTPSTFIDQQNLDVMLTQFDSVGPTQQFQMIRNISSYGFQQDAEIALLKQLPAEMAGFISWDRVAGRQLDTKQIYLDSRGISSSKANALLNTQTGAKFLNKLNKVFILDESVFISNAMAEAWAMAYSFSSRSGDKLKKMIGKNIIADPLVLEGVSGRSGLFSTTNNMKIQLPALVGELDENDIKEVTGKDRVFIDIGTGSLVDFIKTSGTSIQPVNYTSTSWKILFRGGMDGLLVDANGEPIILNEDSYPALAKAMKQKL